MMEKNIYQKFFSLFLSAFLVVSIISFSINFASAQESTEQASEEPFNYDKFDETFGTEDVDLSKTSDFNIENLGDGNFKISGDGLDSGTTSLDEMKEKFSGRDYFDSEKGTLDVNVGGEKRKISLSDMPDEVKNVNVDEESKSLVYETENEGKISIGQDDSYLKNEDGKTMVKDYKTKDGKTDLEVSLGEGDGNIEIDNEGEINFDGDKTTIKHNSNEFSTENENGGKLKVVSKDGYEISNSIIKNDDFSLDVSNEKIYFGDLENIPDGFDKKSLDFEDGNLKGDLSGLGDGQELKFENKLDDYLNIESTLTNDGNNLEVSSGESALLTNDNAYVLSRGASRSVDPENVLQIPTLTEDLDLPDIPITDGETIAGVPRNSGNDPDLPISNEGATTGTPSTGDSTTGTPSTGTPSTGTPSTGDQTTGTPSTGDQTTGTPSTGTPSTGTPSTGGGSSGGTSGGSSGGTSGGGSTSGTPPGTNPQSDGFYAKGWLKWALIIGGGAIAAMLLLQDDDEDQSGDEDEVDDGGEPYLGTGTENTGGSNTGNEANYNPEDGSDSQSCKCDETGCYLCPDDNCFQCPSTGNVPSVQ